MSSIAVFDHIFWDQNTRFPSFLFHLLHSFLFLISWVCWRRGKESLLEYKKDGGGAEEDEEVNDGGEEEVVGFWV